GAYEDGLKEGYLEAVKKQMAACGLVPQLGLDDAPTGDAELRVRAAALKAAGTELPKVLVCQAKKAPLASYAGRAAEELKKDGFDVTLEAEDAEDDWEFRNGALKKALAWITDGKEGSHGCSTL
ncbi:MAG: hypothetical protein IKX89_03695, partial [Firmicutes bacterium]|nr:hypothetical protein [Bacillota bacterium]